MGKSSQMQNYTIQMKDTFKIVSNVFRFVLNASPFANMMCLTLNSVIKIWEISEFLVNLEVFECMLGFQHNEV